MHTYDNKGIILRLVTLEYLLAVLVELNASTVLETRLETPNILDAVLARPVECAVSVVAVVLEAAAI